jgi:pimeloyl-ACP methyl ester carboxylesterase
MRSRSKRGFLLESASFILLATVLAAMAVGQDVASPRTKFPTETSPYLTPQRLIRVGEGRTINLICIGNGSPTVILTAGSGSWAIVWRSVQPSLASRTRVCAWDPAGFGFSSPSPDPQDAVHLTKDLEQTLKGAGIKGPYLMVAHSAGAFIALRFADRHPKSVVGMVLVDPAIPEQDAVMRRVAPKFATRVDGLRSAQTESLRHCAAELRSGSLKRGTQEFNECTTAPSLPAAFSALEAALSGLNADPARLLTEASSLDNFLESQHEAINPQRRYGDMPLMVLTAERRDMPSDTPAEERKQGTLFYREAGLAHDAYAALSTRGHDQLVPDSGHNIPVEKPEVVVAVINHVLAECKPRTVEPGRMD